MMPVWAQNEKLLLLWYLRFQTGRFFGDIDPVLAKKLFNTSVYSIEQEYDYQASCPVPAQTVNAGFRSFYIVSIQHSFW